MSTIRAAPCGLCRCPTDVAGAGILVGFVNRIWEAVRCPLCEEHGRTSLFADATRLPVPSTRDTAASAPWKPLRDSPAARFKAAGDVDGAKAWIERAIVSGLRYA